MPQTSGLLQLIDERNILLGNGLVLYGNPLVNLGQVKGDASFNYTMRPYDVKGGNPLILLRRFTLEETCNVVTPLLEIQATSLALYFRNFTNGAVTVQGSASGGGTLYVQTFGGFEHPTPEQGYIAVTGYSVYPPLELRLPFPEQRETIMDATFEFKHMSTNAPGNQLGEFDVFVMPIS